MTEKLRIAIDTGGTFTDCVYRSGSELRVLKIASTPDDPGRAVVEAVARIAGPKGSAEIRHGTTVGTNALLERTGARVAFITTAGFEDTVEIGRQARPKLYDWFWKKEPALAPAGMRFGVDERVTAEGEVLRALEPEQVAELVRTIRVQQAESVAVSLLFSFVNPVNEKTIEEALGTLGVPLSMSYKILPEFREYERGSTVLINAYLAPKMSVYLGRLDSAMKSRGSELHVMQSSGGIVEANVAAEEPVRTILSGPAGGVMGAIHVARLAGFRRVLSFDMGGTSTDVSLIEEGSGLHTTTESQLLGMPVAVPMLNIHTVGAGGGSLAGFDPGGVLKVGPESAGANPGPACYGSGEQPTVTDANLVLGRIDPESFLGGGMKLDEERARDALAREKGNLADAETFADGIVRLSDAHMEKALRKISVERGHDPRDFVLVSFGGAGPLHACALARALQIPTVLVPRHPGALSAYGILVSDVVRDYSRTVMLAPGDPQIEKHFRELECAGTVRGAAGAVVRSADLRYRGQGYELRVDWSDDPVRDFHVMHRKRYGYSDLRRAVEIVNLRVRVIVATEQIEPERFECRDGDGRGAILKQRTVWFDGAKLEALVYDRTRLHSGDRFPGPAVVVEYSATTFLPPEARTRVDEYGNMIVDV